MSFVIIVCVSCLSLSYCLVSSLQPCYHLLGKCWESADFSVSYYELLGGLILCSSCLYCSIYINDSSALYWRFKYNWYFHLACSLIWYRARQSQSPVSSKIIETPSKYWSVTGERYCLPFIAFACHVVEYSCVQPPSVNSRDESDSQVISSLYLLPMVVSGNFALYVISSQIWPINCF